MSVLKFWCNVSIVGMLRKYTLKICGIINGNMKALSKKRGVLDDLQGRDVAIDLPQFDGAVGGEVSGWREHNLWGGSPYITVQVNVGGKDYSMSANRFAEWTQEVEDIEV